MYRQPSEQFIPAPEKICIKALTGRASYLHQIYQLHSHAASQTGNLIQHKMNSAQ